MEFAELTVPQLLITHVGVLEELRRREIVRTSNGPGGDYAELLFCRAMQWFPMRNSSSGYDARDDNGLRYQIKGRRLTQFNTSRQLGGIRNLEKRPFDVLAGVLFERDYGVKRAALIPFSVVEQLVRRSNHTNSWRLHLREEVWNIAGVTDVTEVIRAQASFL